VLSHRVLPYGEQALLIEFDSSQEAAAGGQALAAARTEVVTEIVPGMKTQTVRFNHKRANASEINSWINRVLSVADSNQTLHTTAVVEISVQYNGADLHAVATELGLSPA
jgi:allophanate hydrolase subunit 1